MRYKAQALLFELLQPGVTCLVDTSKYLFTVIGRAIYFAVRYALSNSSSIFGLLFSSVFLIRFPLSFFFLFLFYLFFCTFFTTPHPHSKRAKINFVSYVHTENTLEAGPEAL